MVDAAALLAAYDDQMRMPSGSLASNLHIERDGPIERLVGGHAGRIRAPRDLGVTGPELDQLIARQQDYFAARGEGVEWKVRGHDLPTELPERLVAAGFEPETPLSVLLGESTEIAAEPVLPEGVALRQAKSQDDFRRIAAQQTEVWGQDLSWVADHLAAENPDQITILIAEAGPKLVCSAWSIYNPGTNFVALLGGTTLPEWQGRGIYGATIAARAQQAVARGYRLLHVDASPDSAPILRRRGFHQITTSMHYRWASR
jgi:GNAT superfamily N-acetyltransferase